MTLWGQKAWAYLDEIDMHTKPDILGAVEMHLRGTKLTQARRRAKSIGWHMFSTPAVSSQGPGYLEGASSSLADEAFANHGGEAFLVQPHVQAQVYHQGEDAVGYRSLIFRLRQTSVHLVLVYFDHSNVLDAGGNIEKAKEVLRIIGAIRLPWLILGDFNVTPEECGASIFFSGI